MTSAIERYQAWLASRETRAPSLDAVREVEEIIALAKGRKRPSKSTLKKARLQRKKQAEKIIENAVKSAKRKARNDAARKGYWAWARANPEAHHARLEMLASWREKAKLGRSPGASRGFPGP
jgi:hypothetical protein